MQVRSSISCIVACGCPWETEFTVQRIQRRPCKQYLQSKQ